MPNIRETPLKERFEAAAKEFATTYARKSRTARAGVRPYPGAEFLEDVYATAGNHGLFVEALWAYFRTLHGPHQIDGSRKRFGEDNPLRGRVTGSMPPVRSEKALLVGVVASLLVATVVWVYGLYQPPAYKATARVLVGQKEEPSDCARGICPIPNAHTRGIETFTLTVARAIPTTPVAQAVIRRLNLPRGSADKVLDKTSVESDPGTMFVDITYRDSDPHRAQQVANAIGQVVSQKISEVSPGANAITATVWQPATYPQNPVSPNPLRNGLLALVASLTLTSGWAVLLSRPALTTHRSL